MSPLKTLSYLFGKIDRLIEDLSGYTLVASLFFMIALTLINIVLRWFSISILWIEPLVRNLVFFSAFLGALLATGRKSHIGIDLMSRTLEALEQEGLKKMISGLIYASSCLSCAWLSFAGYRFYLDELEYGKIEFLFVHSAAIVAIIPIGCVLLSYRFFYLFWSSHIHEIKA